MKHAKEEKFGTGKSDLTKLEILLLRRVVGWPVDAAAARVAAVYC